MSDAPEEIKARIAIEDLVSQYVQLKKVGRSFKGLCPFHSEKTPSFIVSPDKGIAYCFGCHRGGDVFKFLQEIESIDFVDAMKVLAERTGVKLEQYQQEKTVSGDEKEQLLRIHETAATFYERCLWQTKDGEKVLEYLRHRGLQDATIKLFRLGFAPDSFEQTSTMLLKEGFTKKMLIASGLAIAEDTSGDKIHDRFRCRALFPIQNSLGKIVAFGGRALSKDQEPKYLNSPETPIYSKSNILYGFHGAKPFIKKQNAVIIVEGYMDTIAAYQSGIQNVVASSGTALTSKQLRILKPLAKTLYFAFDMDEAGQEAARRAFELTLEFDFEVKTIDLPSAKDFAEFVQTKPEELPNIINQAQNYGDAFYKKLLQKYGKNDIAARKRVLEEFSSFFALLKSSIEKDYFVRKLAGDFQLSPLQIHDEIKNFKLPLDHPARTHRSLDQQNLASKKYLPDELLLGFMIEFPKIAHILKNNLSEELFQDELKAIYNAFFAYYNGDCNREAKDFILSLAHNLAEKTALLSLYVTERYGEMGEEAVEREMEFLIDNINKKISNLKRKALQQQIEQAEKTGDKTLFLQLLQEMNNLKPH
jgi:DNA primase